VSRYGLPFLWKAVRLDEVTGLLQMRNRYYSVETGRFLTRDPIGVWGDNVNGGYEYAYVGSKPCTASDPFGLYTTVIVLLGTTDPSMNQVLLDRAKSLVSADSEGGEVIVFNQDGTKFEGPMPYVRPVSPENRPWGCDPGDFIDWGIPGDVLEVLAPHGQIDNVTDAKGNRYDVCAMNDPKFAERDNGCLGNEIKAWAEAARKMARRSRIRVTTCFQGLGVVDSDDPRAPTRAHNLATFAADASGMSVEAYKGWIAVDGSSLGPWEGDDADMRERLSRMSSRDAAAFLHKEGVVARPSLVHPR